MKKSKGTNGHDKDGYGLIANMYYDMDGQPMTPADFLAKYPHGRVCVARDSKRAIRLSCEFVGINHTSDPDACPLIYEVLVCFAGAKETHVLASYWAPSVDSARRVYESIRSFVRCGGYLAYYVKHAIIRLWGKL